jgi:hypothetical protein
MSLFRARLVTAVVVAVTLASVAQPANAAMLEPGQGTETHCVVDVIDELSDGELVVSTPRCYPTFVEAVADASNGQMQVPPATEGKALFEDEQLAIAYSTFTLGTHFDGANGSGSSISVVGSSCGGGYWNTGSSWANRISSTWNGCGRLRHYDNPAKGGSSENTYGAGTTDNLGTLNNRTESVSYHSS